MVAPLSDGVYVADARQCYFLSGRSPNEWSVIPLPDYVPPKGCFAVVDGDLFPEVPSVKVAWWLSAKGFVVGLPDGQLILPQSKRLSIPVPSAGSLIVSDRRIFALTL